MESRSAPYILVATALLQALALYVLVSAVEAGNWPTQSAPALLTTHLLAIGLPLFVYLSPLRQGETLLNVVATLLVAAVLLLMGWHGGRVLVPQEEMSPAAMAASLFVPDLLFGAAFLIFITALLFRAWREHPGTGLPWRCQLDAAWGNALTLALVFNFILLLWALLITWAGLFRLIGIDIFMELFRGRAFRYAVTGLAGGVGLALVRSRIGLVTAVRGILEALARVLLPVAAVVVISFMLVLPFAGIDLLWQAGRRPTALLGLAAFTLLFMNAALGDEGFSGRLRPMHWLLAAALLALLLLLLLTITGLLQRVGDFGWTLSRLWALIICLALLGHALAGACSLVLHRALLPETVGRGNTVVALLLMAVIVAVHSPLADLRRFAANDQFARVVDGRIPTVQFDARYVGRSLGRYGVEVLDRLLDSEQARQDPDFAARLEAARRDPMQEPDDVDPLQRFARSLSSSTVAEIPPDLVIILSDMAPFSRVCPTPGVDCRVDRVPFEGEVYWFVAGHVAGVGRHLNGSRLLWQREGAWENVGRLGSSTRCDPRTAEDAPVERGGPVMQRLPDRPGSVMIIDHCVWPILWQVQPQRLPAENLP